MPRFARRKRMTGLKSQDQPLQLHMYDFARRYFFSDTAVYFPARFPEVHPNTIKAIVTEIAQFSDVDKADKQYTALAACIQKYPDVQHEIAHRKPRSSLHSKLQCLILYCQVLWSKDICIRLADWVGRAHFRDNERHLVLGVYSKRPLKETSHLADLNGVVVPITNILFRYLQRNYLLFSIVSMYQYKNRTSSCRVDPGDAVVTAAALAKTKRHVVNSDHDMYVLVGPLSFVNCGCSDHAQVTPARMHVTTGRERKYGDWQKASLHNAVGEDEELLLEYGPKYKLKCPVAGCKK